MFLLFSDFVFKVHWLKRINVHFLCFPYFLWMTCHLIDKNVSLLSANSSVSPVWEFLMAWSYGNTLFVLIKVRAYRRSNMRHRHGKETHGNRLHNMKCLPFHMTACGAAAVTLSAHAPHPDLICGCHGDGAGQPLTSLRIRASTQKLPWLRPNLTPTRGVEFRTFRSLEAAARRTNARTWSEAWERTRGARGLRGDTCLLRCLLSTFTSPPRPSLSASLTTRTHRHVFKTHFLPLSEKSTTT